MYDLFLGRIGWGDGIGDWLRAEEQLVAKPPIELRERDGVFILAAALPGLDAKDITVDVTPQDLVIKASTERKHTKDKGEVHRSEFTSGKFFRSLTFPKGVDPAKATAEYQNGILKVTGPIAASTPAKRAHIKAA